MIASQDRSGWLGASDTSIIMGSWDTVTFARFWTEKLGIIRRDFANKQMLAGTHYEHRILDAIGIQKRDGQIRIRSLRLRVNLDGEDRITIFEVKTHSGEYKVTKAHWRQAQVEMFAARKKLVIVAYHMEPEDYINYFNPIHPERITFHPVEYDPEWIKNEYLPRLRILAECLKKGGRPCLPSTLKTSKPRLTMTGT